MSHYKLALLGFGNVGKALADLLLHKEDDIQNESDVTFSVVGIATGSHGIVIDPDGIDLIQVLDLASSGFSFTSFIKFSTALTLRPFNIFSSGISIPPFSVTFLLFFNLLSGIEQIRKRG